eukprot:m.52752 g.52752  ORF g.52752 m.52752 type:complete len:152 (+) comp7394_c0_seq2:78-533(+)
MALSQAGGVVKGAALGLFSGYALYFGLNLHMWTTVQETLNVLQSAEARITGGDKLTSSLSQSLPAPPVSDYADEEIHRLGQLKRKAGDWWNEHIRQIPAAVTHFKMPALPNFPSGPSGGNDTPAASEVSDDASASIVVETSGSAPSSEGDK